MEPIVDGIKYGLLLAFMAFGPSFFMLLDVGVKKGFRGAMGFAMGIAVSDVLLIFLIMVGLGPLFESEVFQEFFGLISGVLVFGLGMYYLFWKKEAKERESKFKEETPFYQFILKGFTMNALNPFTVIMWTTVAGTISIQVDYGREEYIEFFLTIIAVLLVADTLKALFSNWIGRFFTTKRLNLMNRILGGVFIVLSLRLFYTVFEIFSHQS
jgi:threonine/homoserine/homoserine lactone efflux protein